MAPEIPLEQIPKNITPDSSNLDVQLLVFDQLLKYNSNRTKPQAWKLASSVVGNGEEVFRLKEDYWKTLFGYPEGTMLYGKIAEEKINSEPTATDVSNLFFSSIKMLDTLGRYYLAVYPLHWGDAYLGQRMHRFLRWHQNSQTQYHEAIRNYDRLLRSVLWSAVHHVLHSKSQKQPAPPRIPQSQTTS